MEERKEGSKLGRLRSAVKQQKGKLYIIRKCIAMLICGSPKYADIHHGSCIAYIILYHSFI
jgi:hypothetical protein